MSKCGTHEPYVGYNAIRDWKELDNGWALKFLREAEKLGQENFTNLKTKNNVRARLKRFAYKVIFYNTPQQIPEEVDTQESVLCGVCLDEIDPQILKPITIL
ncbi:4401_t:CDS:2, partial [Diversispora eburnea]